VFTGATRGRRAPSSSARDAFYEEAADDLAADAAAQGAIGAAAGMPAIEQVTRPLRARHLGAVTGHQPASPPQHRPVRPLDRSAVLHDPPPIFSASLLAAAREVRASRTWTGLAGSGRVALIDHRDGENDHTTGTFQEITGRPPRPVADFLRDHRAQFV
jgi:hypothetical protein